MMGKEKKKNGKEQVTETGTILSRNCGWKWWGIYCVSFVLALKGEN
jgi:hypothetical protein